MHNARPQARIFIKVHLLLQRAPTPVAGEDYRAVERPFLGCAKLQVLPAVQNFHHHLHYHAGHAVTFVEEADAVFGEGKSAFAGGWTISSGHMPAKQRFHRRFVACAFCGEIHRDKAPLLA